MLRCGLSIGAVSAVIHLLRAPCSIPCAQFGEVDVDSELVSIREDLEPGQEQIMMLNNGCLCCTVRDDLVDMLNRLVSLGTPVCLVHHGSAVQGSGLGPAACPGDVSQTGPKPAGGCSPVS